MKNIDGFQKFEGGAILPRIMYTGTDFELSGQYDFEIYGQAKCNHSNQVMSGRFRGTGDVHFTLKPGAAVVFWRVPRHKCHPELRQGLPDVPEYLDDHTRNIQDIVRAALLQYGIQSPESDSLESDDYDDLEVFDDDDQDNWPEDEFSLIRFPERTDDSQESDVVASLEARSIPEAEEADEEADDQGEKDISSL